MQENTTCAPANGSVAYAADWRRDNCAVPDNHFTAGSWSVHLNGQEMRWDRFYTGPLVLSSARIDQLAARLLGLRPGSVEVESSTKLRPYVLSSQLRPPAIVMHGATRTTKGFEGDLSDVNAGRHAFDVATYLETRAVYLANSHDLVIGRTYPWRLAIARGNARALDIAKLELYYLSHALLESAAAYDLNPVGPLHKLIAWLKERPNCVIRVYALDLETQIFLLWLSRQAGLDKLNVDANSAVVANDWNQKGHLHPTVEDALALHFDRPQAEPFDTLRREQCSSRLHRLLNISIPVLPGYTIQRTGRNVKEFAAQLSAAATLLRERYGISRGCIKPAEAGDGARIIVGVNLVDQEALKHIASEAFQHGDDYILEPEVTYLDFLLCGQRYIVAPSAHIRFGHVAPGCTVQLLKGTSWFGNVFLDSGSSEQFGISNGHYKTICDTMNILVDGFSQGREALRTDLVIGGVDFAIGRIGGAFGQRVLVAVQDPNLSSHGAEYLRCFMDRVSDETMECVSYRPRYAATKIVRPTFEADIDAFRDAVSAYARPGTFADVIGCVPGRWSMIAAAGPDPRTAAEAVVELESALSAKWLVTY
jgi:hypothetical protein